MLIQVTVRDTRSSTEQQYEFDESPVRIGRNPINNIVLDEDCVSGWHGIVRFDQRAAYYSDLGSTNGTLLGGARLPKSIATPIREPIRLTISVFELTIVTRAGATLALDRRSAPSPLIVGASGHSGQGQAIPASAVAKTQIASPVKGGPSPPLAPQVGRSRIISAGGRHPSTASAPLAASPSARSPSSAALAPVPSSPSARLSPAPANQKAGSPAPTSPAHTASPSAAATSPPAPADLETQERLLRCLRIIAAFSNAFVGLKKGYEQFGAEVGVRPLRGTTALHRARTSQEIVDYLLDPAVDPEACGRDLNAIFADMGIHDLALIEGIAQSLHGLLAKLDPARLDLKAAGLWSGGKAKAKWTSYLEMFSSLLGDDAALHAEIFGEEFATGYASLACGDNAADETDS